MDTLETERQMMLENPDGRRRVVMSRLTWLGGVKIDIKLTGVRNWKAVAVDTIRKRDVFVQAKT